MESPSRSLLGQPTELPPRYSLHAGSCACRFQAAKTRALISSFRPLRGKGGKEKGGRGARFFLQAPCVRGGPGLDRNSRSSDQSAALRGIHRSKAKARPFLLRRRDARTLRALAHRAQGGSLRTTFRNRRNEVIR